MTSDTPLAVPASVLFLRMRGWGENLPSEQSRRRTQLAADRTVLAAELTYAAWMRTGFAALASGVIPDFLDVTLLPLDSELDHYVDE